MPVFLLLLIIIIIIIRFILMMDLQCSLFCYIFYVVFLILREWESPSHMMCICCGIWVTIFTTKQSNNIHDDIYNDDYEFSTVHVSLVSGIHVLFHLGMLLSYVIFITNKHIKFKSCSSQFSYCGI